MVLIPHSQNASLLGTSHTTRWRQVMPLPWHNLTSWWDQLCHCCNRLALWGSRPCSCSCGQRSDRWPVCVVCSGVCWLGCGAVLLLPGPFQKGGGTVLLMVHVATCAMGTELHFPQVVTWCDGFEAWFGLVWSVQCMCFHICSRRRAAVIVAAAAGCTWHHDEITLVCFHPACCASSCP
jgi:hypothetical protein